MTPIVHAPRLRVGRPVSGLGIVEAMILLSAVGLIVAIAVPFAQRGEAARETTRAAEDLARTLRRARARAAELERPVHVAIEPGGAPGFYTAYLPLGDDPGGPGASPREVAAAGLPFAARRGGLPGNVLPARVRFGPGDPGGATERSSAPGRPPNPIVFAPDGTVRWPGAPAGGSGILVLAHVRHPGEVRAVSIRRDGKVAVWSDAGGGGP